MPVNSGVVTVRYRIAALFDEDWASLVGYGVILGLAWVLVAFSTVRALQPGPSGHERALSILIPIIFGLTLFAGGIGMLIHDLFDQAMRIAKWTVLGTIAFLAAIVVNSFWFASGTFDAAFFTLVNSAISGSVLGFLIGIYDAHKTELKRDLAEENEHSTELSQRLSVINRVLRHDMRHQTQLIQGHTERLQNQAVEPTVAADRILTANNRLLDLAEQTRKLQELLSGDQFSRELVDLVSLVENACETVRDRHPQLVIDCQLPDQQPVQSTPLIEDVIKELLDNAAVHNDSDTVRASVSVSREETGEKPVVMRVRDNGPGLPETEPISGDDWIESQLHHSNGFGLWFVTWVIEDSGADIDISTPGMADVGTEITVRFPVAA